MKVKVRDGFQINHGGKLHVGGDTFDAPDALAKRWAESGLAEPVKKKAAAKSKNKAVKSSANKSEKAE